MSAIGALLSRLRTKAAEREQNEAGEYRRLVQTTAAGKVNDPEKLLATLQSLGVHVDRFEADLATYEQRAQLAALVAAQPGAEDRLSKVEKQLAAADEDLTREVESAHAKYADRSQPLLAEQRELAAKIRAANEARARLVREHPDETTRKEWIAAQRRLGEAQVSQTRHEEARARSRRNLADKQAYIAKYSDQVYLGTSQKEDLAKERAELARLTALLAEAEARSADFQAKVAEARAELAAVEKVDVDSLISTRSTAQGSRNALAQPAREDLCRSAGRPPGRGPPSGLRAGPRPLLLPPRPVCAAASHHPQPACEQAGSKQADKELALCVRRRGSVRYLLREPRRDPGLVPRRLPDVKVPGLAALSRRLL